MVLSNCIAEKRVSVIELNRTDSSGVNKIIIVQHDIVQQHQ